MSFAARLKFLDRPVFHLLLIALLGLLAYSNTFNAPFQWDEHDFIVNNYAIKDLGNFKDPFLSKDLGPVGRRYIGYLTFALNYKFNGLDVRGYHAVNIAIHILNAMLVYFLIVLTFRTPFFKREIATPPARNDGEGMSLRGRFDRSNLIALFSAILFVSHPIQTEAVTYIFQRLASLMAFFYLLSIVLYIKWRLTPPPYKSPLTKGGLIGVSLYLLSLLSTVLAMKTKENAFTLPVMIALYEFFFLTVSVKKRLLALVPFLLTMLIIPIAVIGTDKPLGEVIGGLASLPGGGGEISRWDYLFTEFRVIVTYIRLLFLPINQNIDYAYPVFSSFFNPQVFLSFLFLLSLLCLAVYLLYRSKSKPGLRFVSFGIFWFFIALSVESSVIPIPMLINEYRVYLPSVGAFSAIIAGVLLLVTAKNKKMFTAMLACLAVISLLLSYAAYSRNSVWRNELSLWEGVVKKSPHKPGAYNELALAYWAKGRLDDATAQLRTAVKLKPDFIGARYNLAVLYLSRGRRAEANMECSIMESIAPNHPLTADLRKKI